MVRTGAANERPSGASDDRWGHWLYRFQSGGHDFTGGAGRVTDGLLAEVFITGTKLDTAAETNAQNAAIVALLALQPGCPVEVTV